MASADTEKANPCLPGIMALSQANNHLAVSMHRLLSEEKGNVFFSPFSISTAMAMVLCAAEDETEQELRSALGYDTANVKTDDVANVFKEQMSTLLKSQESYTLACANSMVCSKSLKIKDQYKNILADSFKALFLEVNLPQDRVEAVGQINEWVKEKTKNMIPKLIDELHPNALMVLLNAVYFKGSWSQKFDKSKTTAQKFYNKGLKSKSKKVDMMYMKQKFQYTENELFQALQLPYIGEEVAMLVLLPRSKDGLQSVESSLTPQFVQDIKKTMREQKVEVSLPRFRLEYSKSLKSHFQQLGVKKVFTPKAQLGIVPDYEEIWVSKVIHKAVVEVNEEGSEAAAATLVEIVYRCKVYEPVFRADHPFAFIIYDTKSDLILFMGRVEEF